MRVTGKRRAFHKLTVIIAFAMLALLSINVAFASFGQPDGITTEAHAIHRLYLFVLALAAVVFVLVEGALFYAIFKFRRKDDKLPAQFHGSNTVELIWTGIPVLIVIAIFVFTFITLNKVDHKGKSADLTVDVTGFQFSWQFQYNGNDLGPGSDPGSKLKVTVQGTAAQEPTLVIPVNEPVEFRLKSNDVIHAFYVRDFLYKLDVVPGRDNHFTITAHETGTFTGQCAELCGLNHSLMRFSVNVVERPDFDKWVADQAAAQTKSAAKAP